MPVNSPIIGDLSSPVEAPKLAEHTESFAVDIAPDFRPVFILSKVQGRIWNIMHAETERFILKDGQWDYASLPLFFEWSKEHPSDTNIDQRKSQILQAARALMQK